MEAIDFINIIEPEHGRTSCSDDNITNGFYTRYDSWHGRCTRCMYLELIADKGAIPTDFNPEECQG